MVGEFRDLGVNGSEEADVMVWDPSSGLAISANSANAV